MRPAETILQTRIGVQILTREVCRQGEKFHAVSVDQDTQKHQACGGSFKLVGDKEYGYLRGHVENGLDFVGTDR